MGATAPPATAPCDGDLWGHAYGREHLRPFAIRFLEAAQLPPIWMKLCKRVGLESSSP